MKSELEKIIIVTDFVKRWLFPAPHEQKVDFYSGRILAYRLLDTMGYDPERLYDIVPDEYRVTFKNTDAVVSYLTSESGE